MRDACVDLFCSRLVKKCSSLSWHASRQNLSHRRSFKYLSRISPLKKSQNRVLNIMANQNRVLQPHQSSTAPTTDSADQSLSYVDADVCVSSENELVNRIKSLVASTIRFDAAADIDGFDDELDLSAADYTNSSTIVATTNDVDTKLKIAQVMSKHDTIEIDLMTMNVNDLIVQKTESLTFLDVFICDKLNVNVVEQNIKNIVADCIETECALVNEETTELPELFVTKEKIYDINETAIDAIVKEKRILSDKQSMIEDDVLLSLSSSDCHSNDFSLIRKVVQERSNLKMSDAAS